MKTLPVFYRTVRTHLIPTGETTVPLRNVIMLICLNKIKLNMNYVVIGERDYIELVDMLPEVYDFSERNCMRIRSYVVTYLFFALVDLYLEDKR